MKSFYLYRTEDESGISGTGRVAQGFVADNGKAALFWLSEHPSVTVYDSVGEVQAIHGHSGKTELRYEPDYKRAFNEMKAALSGASLLDAVSGRLPHEGASKKMLGDESE
jgi:hypothetical protein